MLSVDPGGIDVFASDLNSFREALTAENRTLKRALTDPRILSGIGNAYSDEILHAAQLSPITLTHKLQPQEWERLFAATRDTLEPLDRPPARRSRGWLSGKGHGISQGNGGPRTLRRTLSQMRRKNSANPLRRQRNQLLLRNAKPVESFLPIAACRGCCARTGRVRSKPWNLSSAASSVECVNVWGGRPRPPPLTLVLLQILRFNPRTRSRSTPTSKAADKSVRPTRPVGNYSSSSFTSPRAAFAFSTIFSCSIPGTVS